jgi:hypothetical protein
MKDDFNLEIIYGKLGQAIANRNYHDGIKNPLKELLKFSGNAEAEDVVTDTVAFAADKLGAQHGLYLIHELLGEKPSPALTAFMLDKWDALLVAEVTREPTSALSYLTSGARNMEDGHPLSPLALSRWSRLVDALSPMSDFENKVTFNIDNVKNPAFRAAALSKLSELKDAQPAMVLEQMLAVVSGQFYSFKDKDPASAKIVITTLADILEAHQGEYDAKKKSDIAWKVFSNGEGMNAEAEQIAARVYLDAAAELADKNAGFDMYHGLIQRRHNRHIAGESRDAAFEVLAMIDAGRLPGNKTPNDIARLVMEEIFTPAIADATKDADLAARASDTLLGLVRSELSGNDAKHSYLHFNAAIALLKYYPSDDPRVTETVSIWQTALTKNFKGGDDYYTRQMGWMADVAAARGDTVLAEFAKNEWVDGVRAMSNAKMQATEAYKIVQGIVVNAAHYGSDSILVAEARKLLPETEQRAGVVHMPATLSRTDYKKFLQEKRAPKP